MKNNRYKILIGLVTVILLGLTSFFVLFNNSGNKIESLKKDAINAAQEFLAGNGIAMSGEDSFKLPLALLDSAGYLEGYDKDCIDYSIVTIHGTEYNAEIACGSTEENKTQFATTMFGPLSGDIVQPLEVQEQRTSTRLTTGNVILALIANEEVFMESGNEGWTPLNVGGEVIGFWKTFKANAVEDVLITSLVAEPESNMSKIVVNNIVTVTYSATKLTNQDVDVTIGLVYPDDMDILDYKTIELLSTDLNPSDWDLSAGGLVLSKTFEENVVENIVIANSNDNAETRAITITVGNIDKLVPEATPSYSTTSPTNGNVIVTLTTNKEIKTPSGWAKTNATTYTRTYAENTSVDGNDVTLTDNAGNSNTVTIVVRNIDRETPTATVEYDPSGATNGSVTVTLTLNESGKEFSDTVPGLSWTKTNATTYVKTYSVNTPLGGEEITFFDTAGNEGTVTVTIRNIDGTTPTVGVSYNPETPTNGNVVVTLTLVEIGKEFAITPPTGWTRMSATTYEKEYTSNTDEAGEEITFFDTAGNSGIIIVTVRNIDRATPTATVDYSTTADTNGNVTVTLTLNEVGKEFAITSPTGWTRTSATTYEKEYTSNTVVVGEEITFFDTAGNEGSVTVTVRNIDKRIPTATATLSPETDTTGAVKVTLTLNESNKEFAITPPTGWTRKSATTYEKTYLSNTSEEGQPIAIFDTLGNEGSVTVIVRNITVDTALVLDVTYSPAKSGGPVNTAVIVQITGNRELQPMDGWFLTTDKMSLRKSFLYNTNPAEIIEVEDTLGTKGFVEVEIDWIDRVRPTAAFALDPSGSTTDPVTVTLTASEPLRDLDGWTRIDDLTFEKEYTSNTDSIGELVTMTDIAGNTGTIRVIVRNISATTFTLTESYSTTEPTNGVVVVTVTSTRGLVAKDGWIRSSDGFTMRKSFTQNTIGEVVSFEDFTGATESVTITIENIDRVTPTVTASSDPSGQTAGNVTVTLTLDQVGKELSLDADKTPTGWTRATATTLTKVFTDDTVVAETVTFYDTAGNMGTTSVTVANIDRETPTVAISRNPSAPTAGNVTVTLTLNEVGKEFSEISAEIPAGWTRATATTLTKVFTDNTTTAEEVVFYDTLGNEGSIEVTVTNIDRTEPTVTISRNPSGTTNQDVTVTLTLNEEGKVFAEIPPTGWTRATDTTLTKVFADNTTTAEEVEFEDSLGNEGSIEVEVTNIDRVEPTVTTSRNPSGPTRGDVTVTLTLNEEGKVFAATPPTGWTRATDTTLTKVFTDNTTTAEEVEFFDTAGNEGSIEVTVSNIDRVEPTVSISRNPSGTTNQDVLVTLTLNEEGKVFAEIPPTGWTRATDTTLTKVFTNNTTTAEEVEFEDSLGNEGSIEVTVSNIDREAPTVSVSKSPSGPTNQDVLVTLTLNEEGKVFAATPPTGWTRATDTTLTKVFTDNTTATEEVEFEDVAGNEGSIEVTVSNIFRTKPNLAVLLTPTDPTNKPVVVVITSDRELEPKDGWIRSIDGLTLRRSYTYNTTTPETVTVTDVAGNDWDVTVNVQNIDRVTPTVTASSDPSGQTAGNVTVTLTLDQVGKEFSTIPAELPTGWTRATATTLTKVFTDNTAVAETVTFYDTAGNIGTTSVTVANIDRETPTVAISRNPSEQTAGNVTVTLTLNEEGKEFAITPPTGWTRATDTTLTKVFTENTTTAELVEFEDSLGNEGSIEVTVTNIDRTEPTVTISRNPSGTTNQDVLVTLTLNEEGKVFAATPPTGWTRESDTTLTKLFTDNTTTAEEVEFEDSLGNEGSTEVTVSNIDRTEPTVTISRSPSVPTAGNVTLTLTLNEEGKVLAEIPPTGWTRESATTLTKVFENNTAVAEEVVFYDTAGNEGSIEVEVTNIDRVEPTVSISRNPSGTTRDDVTVTLTLNEEGKVFAATPPTGWTRATDTTLTKVFTDNTTNAELVEFEDSLGNEGSIEVTVSNIDRSAPTVSVSKSPSGPTNQDVLVTLTLNEEGKVFAATPPSGWTRATDTTLTKVFTDNTVVAELVEFEDVAGNEGSIEVTVSNIFRTRPNLTVLLTPTDPTNGAVAVVITSDRELEPKEGWIRSIDGLTLRSIYVDNTTTPEIVTVTDVAGNDWDVTVEVQNIDRVTPTVSVSKSPSGETAGNVTVTLTLDQVGKEFSLDAETTPEGWTRATDTTLTKVFTDNTEEAELVTFYDRAGNEGSIEVEVTNIDRTEPTVAISRNPNGPTQSNVTVTLTLNEVGKVFAMVPPTGWARATDTTLTKVFTENTTTAELVEFEDSLGNEGSVEVTVSNIDREAPTVAISRNPSGPTRENVTVTLTLNETGKVFSTTPAELPAGWTRATATTLTKEYTNNTATPESVVFYDTAGNMGTTSVTVSNIDRETPTVTISRSPSGQTRNDVTVTLTLNEEGKVFAATPPTGWIRATDTTLTKVFEDNTTVAETVAFYDAAGNAGTTSVTVSNIDREIPTVSISKSPSGTTRDDVTVTLTLNEAGKEFAATPPTGWTRATDTTLTKVFTDNTEEAELVEFEDSLGNEGSIEVEVTNIDRVTPTVTISRNPNGSTNGNVTVTLTLNQEGKEFAITPPTGWERESDTTLTKVFTNNTITAELVEFEDMAGNSGNVSVTVANIDRETPTVAISRNPSGQTAGNVTVTLTLNEEGKEFAATPPTGWTRATDTTLTKVFMNNTTVAETVTFYDTAGNSGTASVSVSNIDREGPSVSVGYSTTATTNKPVVVTVTSSDKELDELEGWLRSEDGMSLRRTYTSNTSETGEPITVRDLLGNESIVTVIVRNIDQAIPIVSISKNPSDPTAGNVLVTLTLNQAGKEFSNIPSEIPAGWERTTSNTLTKTFTNNTIVAELVTFYDTAGNSSTASVEVTNIDRIAPTATYVLNPSVPTMGNVTVTMTPSKEIKTPTGWTPIADGKYTKVYTANTVVAGEVEDLEDLLGNTGTVNIIVRNIDRTAPTFTVGYSATALTNGNVTVTITANEELQLTTDLVNEQWTLSVNKLVLTKVYTANVDETVTITDAAGNTTPAPVKITNIDKIVPTGTVTYSTTVQTNQNVTVTLRTNEDIQTPSGWTRTDARTFTRVYSANTQTPVTFLDLAGNSGNASISINNIDKVAPVITIRGSSNMSMAFGIPYSDDGATANDAVDGAVNVAVTNNVNVNVIGTYSVVYTATDRAGNTATATRTVQVRRAQSSELFRYLNECNDLQDCPYVQGINNVQTKNYVWYSGYLWRVIGVNPDGTVKLMSEDSLSGVAYGASNVYSTSWVSKWLNENFYNTLNNRTSIVTSGTYCNQSWGYATLSNPRNTCDTSVNSNVGLLTLDEYVRVGGKNSYLNNGDNFFLMTTYLTSIWAVEKDGAYAVWNLTPSLGIRPVITIKANTEIREGSGSRNNPYRFVSDTQASANEFLNTRNVGEYVSFAGQTWRIQKVEDSTRLILNDNYKKSGAEVRRQYGTSSFNLSNGIGHYLNNEFYNEVFTTASLRNVLDKMQLYVTPYSRGENPFTSVFNPQTSNRIDAFVGLASVSDIMAARTSPFADKTQFNSWLINYNPNGEVWQMGIGQTLSITRNEPSSGLPYVVGVRPIIAIKGNVRIASGNGTESSPYVLSH